MSQLSGKSVVLAITGSIAAYKVIELARRLTQQGAAVDVVMTRSAQEFITPLTFQALTYRPVLTNMFGLEENAAGHVALGERADVVVVAPATAHTIAKLAHGEADDLIGTTVLATRAPIILAPAMNRFMYLNAATQENLAAVRRRGVRVVDPEEGALASGAVGPGRLAPIERIEAAIREALDSSEALAGRHVLVTAGPTHEAIDPVRYISNRSSGKFGYAIADAARRAAARVTLVSGPTSLPTPFGVDVIPVVSAGEMREAVLASLPDADAVVMAAAVADYHVANASQSKIKRAGRAVELRLEENADILSEVGRHRKSGALVLGFKAETGDPIAGAEKLLREKKPDLVIANDVAVGFGGDDTEIAIVSPDGVERLPAMSKAEAAARIVTLIAERLGV
ncbi:MAG TPA: bifunctional phosphopantothenoylcysteine decarboxylase/phosphopantothenate--cysteine ligase CoaBC [Candidatus Limnocylindria bacterium]|nr:bifunctional phosphopantothenoylcysteine decarboxylase/phosphopantothenate--cysteine ligase CoaBC [Candidatus Limnocylindria bacterium]